VKDEDLLLSDNVPEAGLAVKVQIPLYVTHDNLEWTVPILLNSKMTVQTVKNNLMAQGGGNAFRGVNLTWKGKVVPDEMRTDMLEDIGLLAGGEGELPEADRQALRFIGRKHISVMDIDVGESSNVELTEVTDSMTVREVLQQYQARERRGYLHLPLLSIFIEGETNADSIQVQPNLNLDDTIYNARIGNGDVLALKTGMFEVVVKESAEIEAVLQRNKGVGLQQQRSAAEDVPGIRVHVFDWWKVKQLKDAYSAVVTDGLSANDQLYLDSIGGSSSGVAFQDELSEDKTLYHYQVRDASTLLVKREDFTTNYCYYICADCGNDVKLKQKDGVRCRECGHRIVFKRRIAKPCQYLCR
jgi:DNA-directed RNA polymerase I, II, and III subunit RPABC4